MAAAAAPLPTLPLLLLLLTFLSAASASPHISAVISQSGLDFVKDLLVSRAAEAIVPLEVPDIERSVSIPVIGTVDMVASGIVLHGVAVDDSTVAVGDDGIVVAASLSSVNLTMGWSYSYSAWVVTISDSGNASIQVWVAVFMRSIVVVFFTVREMMLDWRGTSMIDKLMFKISGLVSEFALIGMYGMKQVCKVESSTL